ATSSHDLTVPRLHAIYILSASFFFHAPATTELYTLSLHDALPISPKNDPRRTPTSSQLQLPGLGDEVLAEAVVLLLAHDAEARRDRKSTRLNSSHVAISYAVFCLKKKKKLDDPR